jgi:gas vesicle protein
MSDKEDSKFRGFMWGLIGGAVVALLCTPKTGKEVREEIKHKTDELPGEVNKLLGDIKELYHKSAQLMLSLGQEQCEKIKSSLSDAEKTFKEKLESKEKSGE